MDSNVFLRQKHGLSRLERDGADHQRKRENQGFFFGSISAIRSCKNTHPVTRFRICRERERGWFQREKAERWEKYKTKASSMFALERVGSVVMGVGFTFVLQKQKYLFCFYVTTSSSSGVSSFSRLATREWRGTMWILNRFNGCGGDVGDHHHHPCHSVSSFIMLIIIINLISLVHRLFDLTNK